jgi:glyoxylase-like metal-dependent hydrolase (beta-lactamase superfamily II)
LALALRRDTASTVALGAGELPSLEVLRIPERRPLEHEVVRMRRLGAGTLADQVAAVIASHPPDVPEWGLPDVWLDAGELELSPTCKLEVVPTPGHTRGHVVFHDLDGGLLFAGDHVLPTITPSIGFEPVLSPNPLGDFLASLAVVRARPDAVLFPAHGPVASSVHARVDELVAHHGRRLDQTEAALRHGAGSAFEVAGQLTWTRRERHLDELDLFNQMLAVAETAAHLELLVAQGRVQREGDDVLRYQTT